VALAKAGAKVLVNDLGGSLGGEGADAAPAAQVAEEIRALGGEAVADNENVADFEGAERMVRHAIDELGGLDILVNNAGIGAQGTVEDNDDAEWHRVLDVNVVGMARVTRAALPELRRSEHASIVNTCSAVAFMGLPNRALYSASKGAVLAFTLALAADLLPEGIRVNAVAPGWMVGEWMEEQLGDNYDRLMERRARLTPLRRCVTADDVAEVMVALVTSLSFVNGEIVVVDGGFASTT
jgi:3-oxoacyl-[acyl-carrier protein] reductase